MQGITSLAQQVDPMAAAAPVKQEPLWKSYQEFHAGNPDALKSAHYRTSALPGSSEANAINKMGWNFASNPIKSKYANPYMGRMEYNQYMSTLPKEYQLLAGAGINPSAVESGAVKGVYDRGTQSILKIPLRGGGYAGEGSGSTHALSGDVLNKMWR